MATTAPMRGEGEGHHADQRPVAQPDPVEVSMLSRSLRARSAFSTVVFPVFTTCEVESCRSRLAKPSGVLRNRTLRATCSNASVWRHTKSTSASKARYALLIDDVWAQVHGSRNKSAGASAA